MLHARQAIGSGLARAFPSSDWQVEIWTTGDPSRVFRDATAARFPVHEIGDLGGDELLERARRCETPLEVVTNDEYCLEACASLRRRLGLAVRLPTDLGPWLDKVTMKRRLADASIATPPFVNLSPVQPRNAGPKVLGTLGLPVVLKPARGANNRGIVVCRSEAELAAWLRQHAGEDGWFAESFLTGRLYHANAVVIEGDITSVQVGRYTRPLLALGDGRPVGSLTLADDHPVTVAGAELGTRVIRALGDGGSFVTHVEFFQTPDRGLAVIDAAARAPGGLVSEIAAVRTGIHLEAVNLSLQVGRRPSLQRQDGPFAAWLWLSEDPALVRRVWGRLALRSVATVRAQSTPLASAMLLVSDRVTDLARDLRDLERGLRAERGGASRRAGH